MSDVLDQIVQHKKAEVESARRRCSIDELKNRISRERPPRDFFGAVTRPPCTLRVIAEIKKASPSAGLIREDFHPDEIATAYDAAGAAAISCLTDEKFFQGSLAYIAQIKQAVRLPVLRKDFIIDPYQIYESRAFGADAILLIAECMEDDAQLSSLLDMATELELTVLVEVHEQVRLAQLQSHLQARSKSRILLGINNRDLKSMKTDLNHTMRLLEQVDNRSILVSESGIQTSDDVRRLCQAGVNRILVGEHLMRQPDITRALRDLIDR